MIKTPTVFVLGAGASMPYGFPSGAELRQELVEEFTSPLKTSTGASLTKLSKLGAAQVRDFAQAFSRSNMASVDAFLAKRQEFADVGKAAIALILSKKEVDANLFSDRIGDHWYRVLWNALMLDTTELADIARNTVRFVTFNYDRSLEQFLHQSIKHAWGVHDVHALTILKDVPILHVYGSLGPFHYEEQPSHRTYGQELTTDLLQLSAASLHVIPEPSQGRSFRGS